ncbi:MAG: hypothetical protein PQJ61_11960 [Spirochaetales bacterium]|uniref:Uncharacterized protein n=1 Tax=Candidatus Thalassospirochaeta sargassi TaxID=3119039 RepID=A0AAJ1IG05_9SPIO|nr:hypothetical protein [Spirochaetales bacterium]
MILFVVLCAILFMLGGKAGNERIWDDYYIIGLPAGSAEEVLDRYLSDYETVSYYNSSFIFNDFQLMDTVNLKDVASRFIEGDPRVDAYMAGAENYFFTSDSDGNKYELIYVKSEKSFKTFYLSIQRAAGDSADEWIFPDFNIKNRVSTLVLFSICWFFGIWNAKGFRLSAAAAGLPWIAAVIVNSSVILPAAVLIYMTFILLLKETYPDFIYYLNYGIVRFRTGIALHAIAFAAAMISGMILTIRQGGPLIPIVISILEGCISMFVFYSLRSQRVRMQEHRLFFPVSIKSGERAYDAGSRLPETAAAVAAIVLLPLFTLFFQHELPVEVPVPQESVDSFSSWSWESLGYLDKTDEGLVNAADFVTHRAYQEGFMYDREWGFPDQDEQIISGEYVAVKSQIEYREKCIQQFTEDWYTSIINTNLETGLTALLLSQRSPGGIILKSDISDKVGSFYPVNYVLISLLAILPVTGYIFSNVKITVRRKGQEA